MMKRAVVLMAIACVMSSPFDLHAEKRRAAAPATDRISIAFVDVPAAASSLASRGSDGWLDVKTLTRRWSSADRNTTVQRRIGLRISRSGSVVWGTAVVSARLESWDGRAVIRVDGRRLSETPTIIDARSPVGSTTFHTIEIEVPATAPEGPLAASIAWDATTD
jgi:hypothetical protein